MARDTVIIFGAGASREYGGRLLRGFLENPLELRPRDPKRDDFPHLVEIATRARSSIRRMMPNTAVDVENVEELLSIIEMAERLDVAILSDVPPSDLTIQFRNAISRIVELSVQVFQDDSGTIMFGPDRKSWGIYGGLFNECKDLAARASVITFNYDCALEVDLNNLGIDIEWAPKLGMQVTSKNQSTIPVYKLHGSCNWLHCSCGLPLVYNLQELKWTGDNRPVGSGPHRPILTTRMDRQSSEQLRENIVNRSSHAGCLLPESRERYIVHPSLYKRTLSEFDAHQWAMAGEALRRAQYIVLVGYSWPESDSFFRHFLAVGTAEGEYIERFLVVRPTGPEETTEKIASHYQRMLGPATLAKFVLCPTGFRDWSHGNERKEFPIWP